MQDLSGLAKITPKRGFREQGIDKSRDRLDGRVTVLCLRD